MAHELPAVRCQNHEPEVVPGHAVLPETWRLALAVIPQLFLEILLEHCDDSVHCFAALVVDRMVHDPCQEVREPGIKLLNRSTNTSLVSP